MDEFNLNKIQTYMQQLLFRAMCIWYLSKNLKEKQTKFRAMVPFAV